MTEYVTIGRVLGPHGVDGWVRVLPMTDDPERFLAVGEVAVGAESGDETLRAVRDARVARDDVRLLLEGADTREAAEKLRGRLLKVPRAALPELPPGTYYTHDLIGVRVETEEGEYLGDIATVMPTGSNDVYVTRRPGAREEWMVPALKAAIRSVDLVKRLMIVRKEWVT